MALKEFRGIKIIGVDEMLKLLKKQPTRNKSRMIPGELSNA
ncbi:MAG: hypothetical protein QXS66_07940 [Thermoproteota archaeon]